MGYLIAIANMKGGVGKTTTTVSLADTFAARGRRVLVADLDPQANASVCSVGLSNYQQALGAAKTVEHYFTTNVDGQFSEQLPTQVSDYLVAGQSVVTHLGKVLNVTLLPASPELRAAERDIIIKLNSYKLGLRAIEHRLAQILSRDSRTLRKTFDITLFDCAPGISPIAEAAIQIADLVIIPSIPDFLSAQGLPQFCTYLSQQQERGRTHRNQRAAKLFALATRVRANTQHHQQYLSRMRSAADTEAAPYRLFATQIRDTIHVSDAMQMDADKPRTYQQRWGSVGDELEKLANEVDEVLNGHAV
ncbi:MAG: AAA family ATPase [Myxococcales bacterium]|nr:AAA family ATPase [Myxococcales bacterium]